MCLEPNTTTFRHLPESHLFQCQLSPSHQSGLVYTPNIPDSYFRFTAVSANSDDTRAFLTDTVPGKHIYIFTVPSESPLRNCSGSAVSVEFCYKVQKQFFGTTRNIFTLASLTQNHFNIEVNGQETIKTTPQNRICLYATETPNQICCDPAQLHMSLFHTRAFTYSIYSLWSSSLLRIASDNPEYHYKQYQVPLDTLTRTFMVRESYLKSDEPLLLMRFFVGIIVRKITVKYNQWNKSIARTWNHLNYN